MGFADPWSEALDRLQKKLIADRLRRDADILSKRFALRYASIEPERANVKNRYGICDSDGHIRIRLHHASTGKPLKYSSMVNTLCHELAHLRHFNHGPSFKAFYLEILEYARHLGIYRPRNVAPRAVLPSPPVEQAKPERPAGGFRPHSKPEQLDLFGVLMEREN